MLRLGELPFKAPHLLLSRVHPHHSMVIFLLKDLPPNPFGPSDDGNDESLSSGKRGIRTPGTRESTTVFETAPFNHSGIFP